MDTRRASDLHRSPEHRYKHRQVSFCKAGTRFDRSGRGQESGIGCRDERHHRWREGADTLRPVTLRVEASGALPPPWPFSCEGGAVRRGLLARAETAPVFSMPFPVMPCSTMTGRVRPDPDVRRPSRWLGTYVFPVATNAEARTGGRGEGRSGLALGPDRAGRPGPRVARLLHAHRRSWRESAVMLLTASRAEARLPKRVCRSRRSRRPARERGTIPDARAGHAPGRDSHSSSARSIDAAARTMRGTSSATPILCLLVADVRGYGRQRVLILRRRVFHPDAS